MRRAHRQDGNAREIISALRTCGAYVLDLSGVGNHVSDALVIWQNEVIAMEFKNPKGRNKLSPGQAAWLDLWPGKTAVVRSVDEALRVIGIGVRP
jgi:Holliday junction resolvase